MLTTRSKITAGATTLIAGAGLTIILLTGNAGASPSTPSGPVGDETVSCGQIARTTGPAEPGTTQTSSALCTPITMKPGEAPTTTVFATPPAGK